ncbi:MFS transporter [Patulibacter sp. NPDC049589]|uniref:MFS transporter n=1 Tax=Patulibacter sp. NPDC049589 TaxID=3154731 RepID=UPI0034215985
MTGQPVDDEQPHRLLVPVLIGITAIVSIVSSLGAPLIPTVAKAFDVPLRDAQWSLTIALLSATVAAPVLGRLGDGPHRRTAIIGGLGIVFAGSVLAGLGSTMPLLLLGRAMQGIGLGLAPLAMAIARHHLPEDRAGEVIGVLSVTAAAGVGAGYPISGLIAERADVHTAFAFGGLVSGAALIAGVLVIPRSSGAQRAPLDLMGALVLAIGLSALLLAITQAGAQGVSTAWIVAFVVVSGLALSVWVRHQLAVDHPLVDLRQMRERAVVLTIVTALVLGFAMYMFLTLVTEFVQGSDGSAIQVSPLVAGLCLVPFSVFSVLASRTVRPLIPRVGTPALLAAGSAVITLGGIFYVEVHSALWHAFVAMGLIGLGFGWSFAALPMFLTKLVPKREIGSVLGFYQVVRYIGFTSGSALAGAILGHATAAGGRFPAVGGYAAALWVGVAASLGAVFLAIAVGRRSMASAPVESEPDRRAVIREAPSESVSN